MVPNQVDSCLCPPVRAFSTYDCVSDRDSVCVHYRLSIRLCNPQPRGMDSKRIPRNNLTTVLQLHRRRKRKNKVYRASVDNQERNTQTTMIVCLFVCLFVSIPTFFHVVGGVVILVQLPWRLLHLPYTFRSQSSPQHK